MTPSNTTVIVIRFIRHRDAPKFFGFDRNRFDTEVRPYLTTIKVGVQGIAFDIREMEAWADDYKARHGKPAERIVKGGV